MAAERFRVVFGSGYVQVASGRLVREGVRGIRYGVAELDLSKLGERAVMIVLTYPGGDWRRWCSDDGGLDRQIAAFLAAWRAKWGEPVGFWCKEFQQRGAPRVGFDSPRELAQGRPPQEALLHLLCSWRRPGRLWALPIAWLPSSRVEEPKASWPVLHLQARFSKPLQNFVPSVAPERCARPVVSDEANAPGPLKIRPRLDRVRRRLSDWLDDGQLVEP